jgi:hypothetical protein
MSRGNSVKRFPPEPAQPQLAAEASQAKRNDPSRAAQIGHYTQLPRTGRLGTAAAFAANFRIPKQLARQQKRRGLLAIHLLIRVGEWTALWRLDSTNS